MDEKLSDDQAAPENPQDIPVDMVYDPVRCKDSKEQDYPHANPGNHEFIAVKGDYRHIGDDEYSKADYLRRCHAVFNSSDLAIRAGPFAHANGSLLHRVLLSANHQALHLLSPHLGVLADSA